MLPHRSRKPGVPEPLARRPNHLFMNIVLAVGSAGLLLAIAELGMRYLDRPRTVISGWRTASETGPFNQAGWRGRPWRHRPSDFVVVMAGGDAVECPQCPPDETLDLILERALRPHKPNATVITLGSQGHGQDQVLLALQQYLTRERADLIVVRASIAGDVPRNTFRSGQKQPGVTMLKPTYAPRGDQLLGPTDRIGQLVYRSKFSTLLHAPFTDLDRDWNALLPPADPGAAAPPPGIEAQTRTDEALETQRTPWSVWMTPRPARVTYGIALTRALFGAMKRLATLHGARFAVLLTPSGSPSGPEGQGNGPIALEHAGHWFVADPAARDAAVAEITKGFDPVILAAGDARPPSLETERQLMARLAEALNQRNLLTRLTPDRPRH